MATGIPIIIAAPSGGGKTSLVKALVETMPSLAVSVSHTTRPIRAGEQDGVNYNFVSKDEFAALLQRQAFVEHAKVFDNFYGTSREWLEKQLNNGIDVILEIDWQGAQQLRATLPNVISIFILPPSLEVLRQRLIERGQDNPNIIEKRMQKARNEISHYVEFDYLVVNDDFKSALTDLQAIIRSQHLRTEHHAAELARMLNNLLAS